jgi:glucose-6-phosphate 1-dehydrogenase
MTFQAHPASEPHGRLVRVKVLRSIRLISKGAVQAHAFRAQYTSGVVQHFTDDRCEMSGIAQVGNPG